MGFFGTFTYSDGAWGSAAKPGSPALVVDIHDSDIATIDYVPHKGASGRFYLGDEPRIYFEDDSASTPVDRIKEAVGFTTWARQVTGHDISPDSVLELLASGDPDDEPVDVFVEETVAKLLFLAGLPVPPDIARHRSLGQQLSVADLARAATGEHAILAQPRTPPADLTRPKLVIPLVVLFLTVGLGVIGFAKFFHESRLFDSDNPAVVFSKTVGEEAKRLDPVQAELVGTGKDVSVRVAHVTYLQEDDVELSGLAVELRSSQLNGSIGLLPADEVTYAPEPELGNREVATGRIGNSRFQVVATPGRLFLASGESTEETLAILKAMLHDEGIST